MRKQPSQIHVVGAGLAGLAAAVDLIKTGRHVVIHEAASQAGGRARGYYDSWLDRPLDNGNHLLLSCYQATCSLLQAVDASSELIGPDKSHYHFLDPASGEAWAVQVSDTLIPWWILSKRRRIPKTQASDYYGAGIRLVCASKKATVATQLTKTGELARAKLWWPMVEAMMNTSPEQASARLMGAALMRSFLKGGKACRPLFARYGLGISLIDPILHWLKKHGAEIALGSRLRHVVIKQKKARILCFGEEEIILGPDRAVLLALPPHVTLNLLPSLEGPRGYQAILNIHFRVDALGSAPAIGLIAIASDIMPGTFLWLMRRGDILSATVSVANSLTDRPASQLAMRVWADIVAASYVCSPASSSSGFSVRGRSTPFYTEDIFSGLKLDSHMPAKFRVVKEKRATFTQSPEEVRRRPQARIGLDHLALAGDWTDTGLPATIEGAVRSGQKAARALTS